MALRDSSPFPPAFASVENLPPPSSFLSHFDGADAQTTYTAETGQVLTFYGNSQLTTTNKKFGSSALKFGSGSSNYVQIPSNNLFVFPDDFTMDLWIRPEALDGDYRMIFCSEDIFSVNDFQFNLTIGGTLGAQFDLYILGNDYRSDSLSWNIGQWYHIAVVRYGTTLRMFRDGLTVGMWTSVSGVIGNTSRTAIGYRPYIYPSHQFVGQFDEIRVIKGVAAWTDDFTPPTAPYTI